MKKRRLAFSLLELSMVLMIIAVFVGAISQGSRIVKEARLRGARAFVSSSPVASSKGLVLWLETSSDKSFDSNIKDGDSIGTWYDINPQNVDKNNATQSSASLKPTFNETNFDLPVVDFADSGTNTLGSDSMSLPAAVWRAKKGTIFMVSALRPAVSGTATANPLFHFCNKATEDGFGGGTTNYEFHVHYIGTTYGTYAIDVVPSGPNNFTIGQSTFGTAIITKMNILTVTANPGSKFEFFINGGSPLKTSNISVFGNSNVAITNITLGSMVNTGFARKLSGFIGEVIVFNRVLSDNEIAAINEYLGKKWNIRVS